MLTDQTLNLLIIAAPLFIMISFCMNAIINSLVYKVLSFNVTVDTILNAQVFGAKTCKIL